jgi:hypothetical protein
MASLLFSFSQLPSEVLAAVLGGFSSGKAISTFLVVARGNVTLRHAAFSLCRGALVQRYIELSSRLQEYEEIRDVLDVVREDVRLSVDKDDATITQFSEWCAILDYFETQLATNYSFCQRLHWVVWSGRLEIQYGEIQAYLITPDWTAGAMRYWRTAELANMIVTYSRNADFHFTQERIPYGSLLGMHETDRLRLGLQSIDMTLTAVANNVEARQRALVPLNEAYDENPSVTFVDHSVFIRTHDSVPLGPLLHGRQSLWCCWDKELGEDEWEGAVVSLGEHVIRIMNSFAIDGASFQEKLSEHYRSLSEYCNH